MDVALLGKSSDTRWGVPSTSPTAAAVARNREPLRLAWLGYSLGAALLWWGWTQRNAGYLTPEHGLGYALGILGAAQMVALLGYSLRKRIRALRSLGLLRRWFSTHMALGVVGPMCILFHCNFHIGSVNSAVALGTMLVVAGSGFVGRFLYAKIHHGLYGRRVDLHNLRQAVDDSSRSLGQTLDSLPDVRATLEKLQQDALHVPDGVFAGMAAAAGVGLRTRRTRRILDRRVRKDLRARTRRQPRAMRRQARASAREARGYIRVHMALVRRITRFGFYERLFSLWHVLHVPLFVMMLLTSIVHVVAVHLY